MSFAEPNDGFKPVFKPPPGLPTGMSPLPKSAPIDFPSTSNPIPPGRGVKSPFRKSVPKPIPGSPPRNAPRPDVKPVPTTGPVGRMPVPSYGRIGRQVAWEILKPTPTSDGSPKDFDEPVADPENQPETENQTDLSSDNCLDRVAYGGRPNNPRGIYQIKTIELVQRLGGEADNRSYTINLGFAVRGAHIPTVPIDFQPKQFVRLVSKKTYDTGENQRPYVIYKHSVQLKGLNPRTGKYWEGKKGIFVSRPVYKDSDPGPRYRNESGEYGYWEKLPSQLFAYVSTYLDYCPENPDDDIDPDPEQDYDRTQDEKMACKWQPSNDPYVESLELERIEYQKFRECGMNRGVIEARYDTAYIEIPKLLVEAVKQILENQEKGFAAVCGAKSDAIAVVPEWWSNRIGSGRPQLIIQYAKMKDDGTYDSAKYVVTIPHYKDESFGNSAPDISNINPYEKGQYMGVLTLPDNSKLIVNCKSLDEARIICADLIKITNYAIGDCEFTISERKGQSLKEDRVYPRVMKYFPQGQKDTKPLWIYHLP